MLYLLLLFTFFCSQELHALTLKQKASAIEWQDEKNDFFIKLKLAQTQMQISEPLVIDLVLQAPLGYVVKKKHLKNKLVKTLLFSSKAPLLKTFVFNKDQNGKYTTYTLIAHLYFSTAQEFLFSFFDIDFLPLKKNLKKVTFYTPVYSILVSENKEKSFEKEAPLMAITPEIFPFLSFFNQEALFGKKKQSQEKEKIANRLTQQTFFKWIFFSIVCLSFLAFLLYRFQPKILSSHAPLLPIDSFKINAKEHLKALKQKNFLKSELIAKFLEIEKLCIDFIELKFHLKISIRPPEQLKLLLQALPLELKLKQSLFLFFQSAFYVKFAKGSLDFARYDQALKAAEELIFHPEQLEK